MVVDLIPVERIQAEHTLVVRTQEVLTPVESIRAEFIQEVPAGQVPHALAEDYSQIAVCKGVEGDADEISPP